MPELVSVAQGGPRDGVKLMCPRTWDGRVQRPRINSEAIRYYPGHYRWDSDFLAWVWHADRVAHV